MDTEKPFVKPLPSNNLQNAVFSLLDCLNDKEEVVRHSVENSLLKIGDRHPDEILLIVAEYKKKNPKLTDVIISTILRIIEHVTAASIKLLECETIISCVQFTISELTRHNEPTPNIQKPCKEILVSLGREHCKLVLESLTKLVVPHQVCHFMILETIGQLARSNMNDAIPFIKPLLAMIIPFLSLIKKDYEKQSYAIALQLLCDTITEYQTNLDKSSMDSILSNEPELSENSEGISTPASPTENGDKTITSDEKPKKIMTSSTSSEFQTDISAEVGIIYDVIMQQWLSTRDSKLCSEFLNALSFIYPLLPVQKLIESTNKIISTLLVMYRRSVDRWAVTLFLSSVIDTTLKLDGSLLDNQCDSIISGLFDLISINSDFDKPIQVKAHNEVLRCYDLLAKNYGDKIMEIILRRFSSNDEREKIKSLMLLTYLTNTKDEVVRLRKKEFLTILRTMILNEKSYKIKSILLRTLVAFSQKNFIDHKVFIKFLVHHCCHLVKIQIEQGSAEEAGEFVRSCNNTLIILSRTVPNMDKLLKIELIQYYMMYEYTDAITTLAKCLSTLFERTPEMDPINNPQDDGLDVVNDENNQLILNESAMNVITLPSPESIFVRSLAMMANFEDKERVRSILNFLKHFCPNLGKHLQPLWNKQIADLLETLKIADDDKFYKDLNQFILETIKDLDDCKFSESLVNKMSDQFSLYFTQTSVALPPNSQNQLNQELIVPNLSLERGLLIKIMGYCLCYVSDIPSVDTKINLIINYIKNEKLDNKIAYKEVEEKFLDSSKSLGFISRVHYELLMKKFEIIINEDSIKKSGSFFSGLNFTKDTQKESEKYKMRMLVIFSYNYMMDHTPKLNIIQNSDNRNDKIIEYLSRQLMEMKECQIKKIILVTFLKITDTYLSGSGAGKNGNVEFKHTSELLNLILKIPIANTMGSSTGATSNCGNYGFYDYLPLYPNILKLATNLIKLSPIDEGNFDGTNLLNITAHHFFAAAQNLNSDNEDQQSYLAPHINSSIPELNSFIKVLLERSPHPSALDDVASILEQYIRHKNCQVRICAALIFESTLDSFIKAMRIGCEAPSKFNQTGSMLGKIVPRTIDSSARVREISVNILKKILEIACIYENLTIPDLTMDWMVDLKNIRDNITVEDNLTVIDSANKIARIISNRLTNQQYVVFSKTLLYLLNDHDESASAGAALVLNYFVQYKGNEMFHAIPDLIKDSFQSLKMLNLSNENANTKVNVFKMLESLTKHHCKLVCNEMLLQPLPFDDHVSEYWRTLTSDKDLLGTILDNFLEAIFANNNPYDNLPNEMQSDKMQKTLSHQHFAITCAIREFVFSDNDEAAINEYKHRFTQIFGMLLINIATYTNTVPSMMPVSVQQENAVAEKNVKTLPVNVKSSKKSFSFIPNRDIVKICPVMVVMETFIKLLDHLGMEQIKNVFTMSPALSTSGDLNNFIEFLTPLAVSVANYFSVNSSPMKELITDLNKYMSSPCDPQRIAAIGFYSQIVPLKPCGEISSVIMLHLIAALSDPNALVRGLSIRGLGFVGALTAHDIEKYSELSLAALLKGIDDYNTDCLINIPLESLRGLSRVIEPISREKLELFEVSLTIRIRPFFENQSIEIREAAILLFGDLCYQTKTKGTKELSESLREQLITNLCPFFLHLGENESIISRACKMTLKNVCSLLEIPKLNDKLQRELHDYYQFHYDSFIMDSIRLLCEEMPESVPTFIESSLPYCNSFWNEIRSNACKIIGFLHYFGNNSITNDEYRLELETNSSRKISDQCLKDSEMTVKLNAANALGFVFSSKYNNVS